MTPALITQKKWRVCSPSPETQTLLHETLGIHRIAAQVLLNRGITDAAQARAFLDADAQSLHDPFLLKDMDRAIERVRQAQRNGETVVVFGDYDVDGITASVVLRQVLERFGIKVVNHIPDRMGEGYGLNDQVVEVARTAQAGLMISIDCGITALNEARLLNDHGIDLIIIDHHEPSDQGIPEAVAVIDPKRADCPYPFKHLAAVGLAAKFAQAMFGEVPRDILDFVALGTIADVVPLHGENRIFVKQGLPCIETTRNKGLQALLDVARIKGKSLRPYHAGFVIGPRINAAGRMDSARRALDLFLSDDEVKALHLAQDLDQINTQRQQMQQKIIREALDMVQQSHHLQEQSVIVLAKEGWHIGVLGIVASRIAETFYRPAIVASLDDERGIASARSIENFHLHEALNHCAGDLEEFGGHKLAAGLKVSRDNLERFTDRINAYARQALQDEDLTPILNIDCAVPLSQLDVDLVRLIDSFEPYGEGNRTPIFCSYNVQVKSRPAVLARNTLKFWVSDGRQTWSVVGFGMGNYAQHFNLGDMVDVAYELAIDDWNKAPTVQLKLKDLRLKRSSG